MKDKPLTATEIDKINKKFFNSKSFKKLENKHDKIVEIIANHLYRAFSGKLSK